MGEAEAEAEVLEKLPPLAEGLPVATEKEVLVDGEPPPVLLETDSGTQERPKQMDPLVV